MALYSTFKDSDETRLRKRMDESRMKPVTDVRKIVDSWGRITYVVKMKMEDKKPTN